MQGKPFKTVADAMLIPDEYYCPRREVEKGVLSSCLGDKI